MSQTSVGVDFTLETVQYKFATIIGELCGKPSILSQFAVWLDLRLAEYKLKGSISLDCSGQKPSPEWLHGLKDPVNPSYGESLPGSLSRHESDQNIAQPGKTKPLSRQNDRHSTSTDVVVKTEPRDSVRHDGSRLFGENSHVSRSDRKRHNDSLSYEKLDVFSPSKSRRISATSPRSSIDNSGLSNYFPSQEQTVIGPNMDDLTTNDFDLMNRGSESSYDRGDNSTDMSYQRGDNSDFYSGTGLGDDSMSSESAPLKSFQQQSDAAGKSHVSGYQLVKAEENVRSGSNVPSSSADSIETRQFRRDSNRRGNSRGKVETLKNTFSAVKVIQSWLASAPYHVDLPVEAIRPEDLDRYLAHFFSVVKNRLGGDYHPLSFNALRSCIERYLQHHGYPCSIVKSDIFVSSRLSFKKRMAELQKLHPRRRTSTRNMRPNTSTDLVASLMSQDSPQNADNFSESFSQEITDPAGFPISSQQIVKTEKCMDTTM